MRSHPLTMRSVLKESVVEFESTTEDWRPDAERRKQDELDTLARQPGFEFGVYSRGKLIAAYPLLKQAIRAARKDAGKGLQLRVIDVKHPDRSYWHEERDLTEAVTDELLKTLQREYPQIKRVSDVFNYTINWRAFEGEVKLATRVADGYVSLALGDKQIVMPREQGEELLKVYRQNIRGLKSYVKSRW